MRVFRELTGYVGASEAALALDVGLPWSRMSVIGLPCLLAAAISFLFGLAGPVVMSLGIAFLVLHELVAKYGAAGCAHLANFAMRRWLLLTPRTAIHVRGFPLEAMDR